MTARARHRGSYLSQIVGPKNIVDFDSGFGFTIATGVSQLNDTSGRGNHVAQATGSAQPTRVASVLDGHAAIRFSGAASQYLSRLSFSGAAAGDSPRIYVIGSWSGATPSASQGVLLTLALSASLGPGNCMTVLRFNGTNGLVFQQNQFGAVLATNTAGCNSVPALFDGRFTTGPSTLTLAVNGADVLATTSSAATLTGTPDRCYIGVREDVATQLLTGDFFRGFVVNPAPTATQHTAIKAYLKLQYPTLAIT